jgi:hypothetical protein
MKNRIWMRRAVLSGSASVGLSILAACTSSVESPGTSKQDVALRAIRSTTLTRTLAKGADTKVTFQTLPNSVCEMKADGVEGSLRMLPDDRGVVSLYGRPQADVVGHDLTIECSDDEGNHVTHTLRYGIDEPSSEAVLREAAEAKALEALPHPSAVTLPALSREDALRLSDDELRGRGYPTRPKADTGSADYEDWLQTVSKPFTMLPQLHTTPDPGQHHGPETDATSHTWSGIVLTDGSSVGGGQYDQVGADWLVPSVALTTCVGVGVNSAQSSFWIGLDGWSTGDVVQEGTSSNFWNFLGLSSWQTYFAWVEWYPDNAVDVNLTVNPGDIMRGVVSMSGGGGKTASFGIWNRSLVAGGYTSLSIPSGAPAYTGRQAEWIMENPNGGSQYLADFGVAYMWRQFALDGSGAEHTYKTDPYDVVTMKNGGVNDVTCWINNDADSPNKGYFQYYFHNCD